MSLKDRAKQIKTTIPTIYLCLKDKETPIVAKIIAGLTVGYALSPIDLVPDFIPILGYLDDLIILPLLASLTLKLIPKAVYERNKAKAIDMWANGKPKKWYYAIPIILFWLIIVFVILKIIF